MNHLYKGLGIAGLLLTLNSQPNLEFAINHTLPETIVSEPVIENTIVNIPKIEETETKENDISEKVEPVVEERVSYNPILGSSSYRIRDSNEIEYFDNKDYALIVLSPHFDDAILSVGGIISEYNSDKFIVTFFSTPIIESDYLTNWDRISGFSRSADARNIRIEENATASELLNANPIDKDYIDLQYRSTANDSSIIESITKDIENIINYNNYNGVLVLGPSYMGNTITHPDHAIVSEAFVNSANNNTNENIRFYFYEDLPYTQSRFGNTDISLDRILTGKYNGLALNRHEIKISDEAMNMKIDAINLYPSQVKAFSNFGIDIGRYVKFFGSNRIQDSPHNYYEVIYEIVKD